VVPGAVVEFESVTKVYSTGWLQKQSTQALTDATFHLKPGEICGLVGPNRAGKTTLVKLLLGLCHPTTGKVWRFGEPASVRRTLARVGYVHETQAFPRYMRAVDLLHYHGAMALIPEAQVRQRVPALLTQVGLADRSRDRVSVFSKGMTQRLALAMALLVAGDLFIFDEPVEGLDHSGRLLLRDILTQQKTAGKTVLLISHLFTEVEKLCDRLLVLEAGKLVYSGSVRELTQPNESEPAKPLEAILEGLYKVPNQWTSPHSFTPPAG